MNHSNSAVISPQRVERTGALRWIPPFLFIIAAAGELMAMVVMTIFRYRNQGLEPQLFDLAKTANVAGLLLAFPFILLFLLLALLRRLHSLWLCSAAAVISLTGVVFLSFMPMLSEENRLYGYVGYLVWKGLELAFFVVILEPRTRNFWQKARSVALVALAMAVATGALMIGAILLSPITPSIIEQPRQEYDAGVILGAAVWSGNKPSPVLRERVSRGYDLLKSGAVQFLVLTGSNAPHELPEAEVARRELLRLGVDPTRIVVETQTHSTLDQILYIRDHLMKEQGWSSFIIISDQFHLKRALEICQFNGINAQGVSSESPLGPQNLWIYHLRESAALILYWMFGV